MEHFSGDCRTGRLLIYLLTCKQALFFGSDASYCEPTGSNLTNGILVDRWAISINNRGSLWLTLAPCIGGNQKDKVCFPDVSSEKKFKLAMISHNFRGHKKMLDKSLYPPYVIQEAKESFASPNKSKMTELMQKIYFYHIWYFFVKVQNLPNCILTFKLKETHWKKCQEIVYFQAAVRRMGIGQTTRGTPYVGVQLLSFQDRYLLSYLNDWFSGYLRSTKGCRAPYFKDRQL